MEINVDEEFLKVKSLCDSVQKLEEDIKNLRNFVQILSTNLINLTQQVSSQKI